MLTLLLSLQSEINKISISDRAFGWLVDVRAVLKRITCLVQVSSDEVKMINDPKLEPSHRTLCLARLIKDKRMGKRVYKMLCDLYCITKGNTPVTSDPSSSEPLSQQPAAANVYTYNYNYYYSTPMTSAAASHSGLVVGTETVESFNSPLRHWVIDFLQAVDSDTLAPHLYAKGLLTEDNLERVCLPTMTSGDKVIFLYLNILRHGKQGYETFMNCLKEANEHCGHEEFYDKLSSTLQ